MDIKVPVMFKQRLSPAVHASLLAELLRHVLFARGQIPMPYQQLLQVCTRRVRFAIPVTWSFLVGEKIAVVAEGASHRIQANGYVDTVYAIDRRYSLVCRSAYYFKYYWTVSS